ncbi:MAG: hypothetical protein MSC51_02535 [Mollicutes bacterium]|nr:hypothetical protein [Mollicutes bacterium]
MNEKIILYQKSNIKEAIDNTLKNYSFESIDHQIDNLDSTQSHYTYKQVKYNDEEQITFISYNTIFTISEDVFYLIRIMNILLILIFTIQIVMVK